MEESNRENPNEPKEQEQMQEKERIQDLLQQHKSLSEDQSLTITIPSESQILKTIMSQIQKRQSSKKHSILKIKTHEKLVYMELLIQKTPPIRQLQFTLSKSFSHSSFINMQILCLWDVDFNNCEFLEFLDAPQLHKIYIQSNKITNFKSFAKMSLPCPITFGFMNNLAKKTFLERAKLRKDMEVLELENYIDSFVIQQDLGSLVKFEPQFYDKIWIASKKRVKRDLIMDKLEQRFVMKQRVVKLLE